MSEGAYHGPPEAYARSRAFAPEAEAQVADSLSRLIPAGETVVDLGAGTGRLAHLLLGRGYPVVACDLSRRMLMYLKQHRPAGGARLLEIQGNLDSLPLGAGLFEAVVCVHVLHLVPDWRRGLAGALRILRPAGSLLLGRTEHDDSDPTQRISMEWKEILARRGLPHSRRLSLSSEVVPWLQANGWACRRVIAARWERTRSPQQYLDQVEDGLYPFFRQIPEAEFPAAFAQLRLWAERELGSLEAPAASRVSFAWQVVSRA